jgi:hypothetical protein
LDLQIKKPLTASTAWCKVIRLKESAQCSLRTQLEENIGEADAIIAALNPMMPVFFRLGKT